MDQVEEVKDSQVTESHEDKKLHVKVVEETEEPTEPTTPSVTFPKPLMPMEEKDSIIPLLLSFLVGLLVGAVVVGGVFYYKNSVGKVAETPTPVETITPTETEAPVATEAPVVDISKVKVQILNGSGKAGEATKVKDLLTTAGFKDMVTGNAKKYDYATTEVSLKSKTPAKVYEEIYKALKSAYTVKESVDQLDEASDFDVVITVGQK